MKLRLLGLSTAVMIAIVACGGSEGGMVEGTDVVVRMFDNRFEFTEIRIPVGGTVNWVGAGRQPHNAVAADESWSTETVFGSLDQFDGDSASLSYDQAGEYTFFCTYHGNAQGENMAGVLIVGEPSP
jgi:plastocyanin